MMLLSRETKTTTRIAKARLKRKQAEQHDDNAELQIENHSGDRISDDIQARNEEKRMYALYRIKKIVILSATYDDTLIDFIDQIYQHLVQCASHGMSEEQVRAFEVITCISTVLGDNIQFIFKELESIAPQILRNQDLETISAFVRAITTSLIFTLPNPAQQAPVVVDIIAKIITRWMVQHCKEIDFTVLLGNEDQSQYQAWSEDLNSNDKNKNNQYNSSNINVSDKDSVKSDKLYDIELIDNQSINSDSNWNYENQNEINKPAQSKKQKRKELQRQKKIQEEQEKLKQSQNQSSYFQNKQNQTLEIPNIENSVIFNFPVIVQNDQIILKPTTRTAVEAEPEMEIKENNSQINEIQIINKNQQSIQTEITLQEKSQLDEFDSENNNENGIKSPIVKSSQIQNTSSIIFNSSSTSQSSPFRTTIGTSPKAQTQTLTSQTLYSNMNQNQSSSLQQQQQQSFKQSSQLLPSSFTDRFNQADIEQQFDTFRSKITSATSGEVGKMINTVTKQQLSTSPIPASSPTQVVVAHLDNVGSYSNLISNVSAGPNLEQYQQSNSIRSKKTNSQLQIFKSESQSPQLINNTYNTSNTIQLTLPSQNEESTPRGTLLYECLQCLSFIFASIGMINIPYAASYLELAARLLLDPNLDVRIASAQLIALYSESVHPNHANATGISVNSYVIKSRSVTQVQHQSESTQKSSQNTPQLFLKQSQSPITSKIILPPSPTQYPGNSQQNTASITNANQNQQIQSSDLNTVQRSSSQTSLKIPQFVTVIEQSRVVTVSKMLQWCEVAMTALTRRNNKLWRKKDKAEQRHVFRYSLQIIKDLKLNNEFVKDRDNLSDQYDDNEDDDQIDDDFDQNDEDEFNGEDQGQLIDGNEDDDNWILTANKNQNKKNKKQKYNKQEQDNDIDDDNDIDNEDDYEGISINKQYQQQEIEFHEESELNQTKFSAAITVQISPNEKVTFDAWQMIIRYRFLSDILKEDLQKHLQDNINVRDFLSLGLPISRIDRKSKLNWKKNKDEQKQNERGIYKDRDQKLSKNQAWDQNDDDDDDDDDQDQQINEDSKINQQQNASKKNLKKANIANQKNKNAQQQDDDNEDDSDSEDKDEIKFTKKSKLGKRRGKKNDENQNTEVVNEGWDRKKRGKR